MKYAHKSAMINNGISKRLQVSMRLFHRAVIDSGNKTACGDDRLDERRERRGFILLARCEISDNAFIHIDRKLVALVYRVHRLFTFDNRQTDINRVAVEDTRKAFCDNKRDTALLNRNRCVLALRAAAEIITCDHYIAFLNTVYEGFVQILHAVRCELFFVDGIKVTRGNDNVGINIIAVFYNFTSEVHLNTLLLLSKSHLSCEFWVGFALCRVADFSIIGKNTKPHVNNLLFHATLPRTGRKSYP